MMLAIGLYVGFGLGWGTFTLSGGGFGRGWSLLWRFTALVLGWPVFILNALTSG